MGRITSHDTGRVGEQRVNTWCLEWRRSTKKRDFNAPGKT